MGRGEEEEGGRSRSRGRGEGGERETSRSRARGEGGDEERASSRGRDCVRLPLCLGEEKERGGYSQGGEEEGRENSSLVTLRKSSGSSQQTHASNRSVSIHPQVCHKI